MDMLPPEQMAFLIPNMLGMVEALFIVWVIFSVEKWRGKKEVRKLAAHFIAPPDGSIVGPDLAENVTDEGLRLIEAESKALITDNNSHRLRMKDIMLQHQKSRVTEE